jgi:hypothetical protein
LQLIAKKDGLKMMKKSTVIKRLQKKFPGITGIQDAEEWGGSRYGEAIHLGDAAEGGEIDGLPAADYYVEFPCSVYDHDFGMGVHIKLATALDKMGYYTEWYDGGTIMAFQK